MTWFEALTGFRETDGQDIRARLVIEGRQLISSVNGRRMGVGELSLPSLAELREKVAAGTGPAGRLKVRNVRGDIRAFHLFDEHAGALFQVASQFNMLEMVGPNVTPEMGVTRYEDDHTQGPACAMAAGAATLYRNYFVPIGGRQGQTADRQLDGLSDLGEALALALDRPVSELWRMRNGYALPGRESLEAISRFLTAADEAGLDRLRAKLRIGIHQDIEVTETYAKGQTVTQAFCSALPVAYTSHPASLWEPFARLVLEAAYEATLLAALLNARRGVSPIVLLTRLGGGAFGNADAWIDDAMRRALDLVAHNSLEVLIVNYGPPPGSMLALAERYA
jgi:hypothetical protein